MTRIYFHWIQLGNSLKGCALELDCNMKAQGRSLYDWRVEMQLNVVVVKWYGNKPADLILTYGALDPEYA